MPVAGEQDRWRRYNGQIEDEDRRKNYVAFLHVVSWKKKKKSLKNLAGKLGFLGWVLAHWHALQNRKRSWVSLPILDHNILGGNCWTGLFCYKSYLRWYIIRLLGPNFSFVVMVTSYVTSHCFISKEVVDMGMAFFFPIFRFTNVWNGTLILFPYIESEPDFFYLYFYFI